MRTQSSFRAGRYSPTPNGYEAFVPAPLPPDPPIALDDGHLRSLLSSADMGLGRLDALGYVLPNPDLFVAMYVRKEAVLSSQIEGTQASLVDVFEYEANGGREAFDRGVSEVVNYVAAMHYGLDRVRSLPLSLRLLREIHSVLIPGTRGENRSPGEFRHDQNWIGPPGCGIHDAEFVPPAPSDMRAALEDFERFLHDERPMPALVKAALLHAQFETIHPFRDGNGRLGRLLITFYLCQQGVLERPLLYLSHFFKRRRREYYEKLNAIRHAGEWEEWLEFFLTGVAEVSEGGTNTAREIVAMREEHQGLAAAFRTRGAVQLIDALCRQPVLSISKMAETLGISFPTAAKLAGRFEEAGLLRETTGQERHRRYAYKPYLDLLAEGTFVGQADDARSRAEPEAVADQPQGQPALPSDDA